MVIRSAMKKQCDEKAHGDTVASSLIAWVSDGSGSLPKCWAVAANANHAVHAECQIGFFH
jgi:hypothetical protein